MPVVEQIFAPLTWRIRHLAMYPNQPLDLVKLDDDFEGIHFGLYHQHELCGVASLFIKDGVGWFRKLAVLPLNQHQGFGTQLLQYLIGFAQQEKLTKLWCNARVNAKDFYLKFGFTETDVTFTKNGSGFIVMEKKL